MFDFDFSATFENYDGVAAVAIVIATVLFMLLIAFGWWALAVYVASCIFGFAFKWIYVLGAWMAYHILRGIFKTEKVKDKELD